MAFLKRLFGLEPDLMKMLSARIVTDEDHRYFISFTKHDPELKLSEFVRLPLHYYAKMLFNFDTTNSEMAQAAFILNNMIRSVLSRGISKNSDVLKSAEIDDVAAVVSAPPRNIPREIMATLYFVDEAQRHIITSLPRSAYAQHSVFSTVALIQATLPQLDEASVGILSRALASMNAAYDTGESYSDIRNLAVVPTLAYHSAVRGA